MPTTVLDGSDATVPPSSSVPPASAAPETQPASSAPPVPEPVLPAESTTTVPSLDPEAAIPATPDAIAADITATHTALFDRLAGGAAADATAAALARREQRLVRLLVATPDLVDQALAGLPGDLAAVVADIVRVQAALRALTTPVTPPVTLTATVPEPLPDLLAHYAETEAATGVPVHVLAAVNFVETRFGRILGPSSAGAVGPMQFLPSTWEQYGEGGDINDPRDAIAAAGRFLAATGAPADLEGALFAYNPSDVYVDAILTYADLISADLRWLSTFYAWEVFVITTEGDVQLVPGDGSTA